MRERGCPRLSEHLVIREVGGERVVYAQSSGEVHQLNPTAGYVLDQCDGSTPVGAIINGVTAQFDVDRITAERDVIKLIAEMEARGLVVEPDAEIVMQTRTGE